MSQPPKIFASLLTEVVNARLCMFCGACIAACPVNVVVPTSEEKPTLKGRCILCGLCYYSCPRVELPLKTIESQFFGRERTEKEAVLGIHLGVWSVRATDEETLKVCQDGGVVTTLLKYALKNKIIDHAITVGTESANPWRPKAIIIGDPDQLISTAGSKYVATGSISALADACAGYPDSRLGFVGVPCQIQALQRMRTRGNSKTAERVSLTIGLFCYNTYRYTSLIQEFIEKQHNVDPAQITKMECKDGVFRAFQNGTMRIEVPLKELEPFVLPACQKCQDFTGELADLSIGHVGSEEGWCTVITRTQKGVSILEEASAAGHVHSKPVSSADPGMNKIIRLSAKKKERKATYIREGPPLLSD